METFRHRLLNFYNNHAVPCLVGPVDMVRNDRRARRTGSVIRIGDPYPHDEQDRVSRARADDNAELDLSENLTITRNQKLFLLR